MEVDAMRTLRARCSLLALLSLAAAPAAQREALQSKAKLDFTPFAGTWKHRAELQPILAGELVLVTTTLRLFAFDMHTERLRWSAGPPRGWDELERAARDRLFDGLDVRQLWIAPGAGERVAVAALQVPLSRTASEEWQGIRIETSLPERRLFAFELGTGRPLWNHAPSPDWDGRNGPQPERMSLIGSPTVVGDRVLTVSSSDQSSVDYHVSCYQLASGALHWSTFVVRGQVEHNMFGRAVIEFAAAPLVAIPARGVVLASTGLGVVAALDLATGQVLWRTDYTPIPIPKARSYSPPKRDTVWRTTPPVVVGGVVLVAPRDSRDLMALDLADGRLLWSLPSSVLNALDADTAELSFDHLIGADERVFYLGGAKTSALAKPGGMRSVEAPVPQWTERVENAEWARHGQLAPDAVVVVGAFESPVFLERERGHRLGRLVLDAARGLLVTDEELFVLTDAGLDRIER
jgi:outer membrane protein assembly factor BamB